MFNFLRRKKNYPNCNLCIWETERNCSGQGYQNCDNVYANEHCFKLYNIEDVRKYSFKSEQEKK
jgi:hypothetical protein